MFTPVASIAWYQSTVVTMRFSVIQAFFSSKSPCIMSCNGWYFSLFMFSPKYPIFLLRIAIFSAYFGELFREWYDCVSLMFLFSFRYICPCRKYFQYVAYLTNCSVIVTFFVVGFLGMGITVDSNQSIGISLPLIKYLSSYVKILLFNEFENIPWDVIRLYCFSTLLLNLGFSPLRLKTSYCSCNKSCLALPIKRWPFLGSFRISIF